MGNTGTVLCVLDSMCPCLYVSISLCVQGSMWQISCRIDPLWLWFYVSRVLCGPGSMWPLLYKLTLCVVGPKCPGSNVTNALCVQGSMCPWLFVAIVYMLCIVCHLKSISCNRGELLNVAILNYLSQPNLNHDLTSTTT